ncbi:MAG: 2-amino-4-hydroxy-6-hydroxymethyldihydropteridine diphosphokinase [Candidatus Thiodiazotropha lotti]|uniref:2-amino-4-hydroxy-6-hydroxymethyldihydropteridine diphosphokinase n=1 Tax=Candidatus Thiodiazotropha lotti TaxID=2792787 RepID=A0A9E4N058_9GAMM|nr:2-amino-4-hydroxy-6-hydroxymethyldihydropteridine diphosphokinase [Candidatus Thiodiazotropha lotti]ODC00584.1 2-amino-4-hydroxy-6-hydroxymethyldihydropteridine diphosphokinase [Candidatus Thiodiazotropha endoloripes]MCG7920218.1 2-amino-4-hydroxy-6-hydroxymethyldihydropteridine diphosphokinase [Candidatus Thiodiazotropha lotti]MCG7928585.1 2-amino-4-hydroxy-6-hydroxymethyldihydropteridine diphosphokinase [Candidatus Thiodiazotropha lotti]MCG7938164.1 2-amino-4-hydroxy-6-hydroxymethyldihydro
MTDTARVRAWLSLGSNQSPRRYLPSAIDDLRESFGNLTISPVYESEAVGFVGENFLNLVVGICTSLSAVAVNRRLKEIEKRHGRVRNENRFTARTLDIDLLTYGDQVIEHDGIRLPRDEILHYAFVLRPLSEVAGAEIHPEEGKSYQQLWQGFDHSTQALWPVSLELQKVDQSPRG